MGFFLRFFLTTFISSNICFFLQKGIKKKRRGSVVVKKDGSKVEESAFDWGFEMDDVDGGGGGGSSASAPAPAPAKKKFVEKPHSERRRGSGVNVEIVKMQRQSMKKAKAKGRRSSADEVSVSKSGNLLLPRICSRTLDRLLRPLFEP